MAIKVIHKQDLYRQQAAKYANKVLRLDDEKVTFNSVNYTISLIKINSVLYVRTDSFYRLQEGLVYLMKGKSPQLTKFDILHLFPKSGRVIRKYIAYQTLLKVSDKVKASFPHYMRSYVQQFDNFLDFIGRYPLNLITDNEVDAKELSESTKNYFTYLEYLAVIRKIKRLSSDEARQSVLEEFAKAHPLDFVGSADESSNSVDKVSNSADKEFKAMKNQSVFPQESSEQDSPSIQYDMVASPSVLSSEVLSHVRALEKLGWHVALYKL